MDVRPACRKIALLDDPRVLVVDVLADLRIAGRVLLVDCDGSFDPFARSPSVVMCFSRFPESTGQSEIAWRRV